jgi:hypothetical protein
MNSLEKLKEQNQWNRIVDQIKLNYSVKEVQNKHISNLEEFFKKINLPDGWNIKIDWFDFSTLEGFPYSHVYIENNGLNVLSFSIELYTDYYHDCRIITGSLLVYFYNAYVELRFSPSNINFDKLISKYDDFSKIIKEICVQ